MAMSVDVNLPRDHAAQFPDCCVVCSAAEPTSHVRIITGTVGWWTWLFWWFGKPFIVKAPACSGCAWKLQGMRLLSLLVTLVIAVLVLWYVWPYLDDEVPRALHKWLAMGLILIVLSPQIAYEVFFPKPFDVTAYSDNVDYEFKSRDYAIAFAAQNLDANWVKLNGTDIHSCEAE